MKKIICNCNQVTINEIHKIIAHRDYFDLNTIQLATGAGNSCGKCRPLILKLVEESMSKKKVIQLKIDF